MTVFCRLELVTRREETIRFWHGLAISGQPNARKSTPPELPRDNVPTIFESLAKPYWIETTTFLRGRCEVLFRPRLDCWNSIPDFITSKA